MNLFFVIIGIILSSFLIFNNEVPLYLKYFSPFLVLTLVVELLAINLAKRSIHTIPLFNFFGIVEFCFYMWVIKNIIKTEKVKIIINYISIILPIVATLNLFFYQGINSYNSITYSIGCVSIIFLTIFYFFELFKLQHAVKLSTDSGFWICTALLFFYCVSFPIFVSTNLIKNFPVKLAHIISLTLLILNVVLYSLFCIAFLCRIKIRKYFL